MRSEKSRQITKEWNQNWRDTKNEVGKLPRIKTPALRKKMIASLQVFLQKGFPDLFSDPFGPVQLAAIEHEQHVLTTGVGNLNKLEPRGYGKSTRSILGATWACLTGVQNFVLVCCDSTEKSTDLLKMTLMALGDNQVLLGCFPELACFHALQGNPFRCSYQLYKGKKTKISIKGDTIVFPTLGEKIASEGALIVARPFMKTRGKNVEGRRPSVVILDDVQSTEDALSPTSVAKNIRILTTDIASLGTKKKPVAIINNATVITGEDYPTKLAGMQAFTTVRYKMVTSMPHDLTMWQKYQDIRQAYSTDDILGRQDAAAAALKFYSKNRKAMDAGAEVTWDHAYSTARSEISTIQAAMNFIADFGQEAFDSECQNEPQDDSGPMGLLTIAEIQQKTNGVPANIVPMDCEKVVAMVDVHEQILDYEVWGFDRYFGGHKILGGTWPPQKTKHFDHHKPPNPLSRLYPGSEASARICRGLDDLWDELLGRSWRREDDVTMSIARLLTDANGLHSDAIMRHARQSEYRARITPSYGMGITVRKVPISRLKDNKGRKDIGPEWAWKKAKPGDIPAVIFDTNYWKTRFHQQLSMPKGERAALLLHEGPDGIHQRSAEAYRAEKPIEVSANGRTIREWELLPNHHNHPFDCAVGCMVAASMEGIVTTERPKKKKRLSLGELAK